MFIVQISCEFTPGTGTHTFTASSNMGRIQHLDILLQLYTVIVI